MRRLLFAIVAIGLTGCQEPLVVVMDRAQARDAGLLDSPAASTARAAPAPAAHADAAPPRPDAAPGPASHAEGPGTGGAGSGEAPSPSCGVPVSVVERTSEGAVLVPDDGRRRAVVFDEKTRFLGATIGVASDVVAGSRVFLLQKAPDEPALVVSDAPLTDEQCERLTSERR